MRILSITFVAALGALAIGCGGGGGSLGGACDNVCDCAIADGEFEESERGECLDFCEGLFDGLSSDCYGCIEDASCSDEDACESECQAPNELAPVSRMDADQMTALGY